MTAFEQRFQDYLTDIGGERPRLSRLSGKRAGSLPLHLRERYHLMQTQMFGRQWILAMETGEWPLASAQEYAQHMGRLAAAAGEERIVLALAALPSWLRNRLVQAQVPFVVPGSQLYLPSFAIDLRERAPALKKAPAKTLTPAAQMVLLFHLQTQRLDDLPLRDIAARVGYSPMMITKVKDELVAAGLCETVREGRSLVLKFAPDRRALWHKAEPSLTSPVRKSHWIRWKTPHYPAVAAGLTALSHPTMIHDDPLPTYALPEANFRSYLESGVFHGCHDASEATCKMQAWVYNPLLLGDDKDVDPLSLYLSLRDSPDERVQQQLNLLLEQVPW